jgi:hypothetical protein
MRDPQHQDEVLLRGLDDLELEIVRHQFLLDRDQRFEVALRLLVLRAVPVIERVCRERGVALGLGRSKVGLAIEDASARVLLRLSQPEELPPVGAIAAQIAAVCTDAQRPQLHGLPLPLNDWRTS